MTNQTRREFLGKLGWMAVGSLIVPYVPKTSYSIPRPTIIDQTRNQIVMDALQVEAPYIIFFDRHLNVQEIKDKYNISWVKNAGWPEDRLYDGVAKLGRMTNGIHIKRN